MKWRSLSKSSRCKCVALDSNGKRCRRRAVWEGPYHGDHEFVIDLEDREVSWILAKFCSKHAKYVK